MKKTCLYILLGLCFGYSSLAQGTKVLNLKGQWKFTIGDREAYRLKDYDDSAWESIFAPSPWEHQGFPNFNGFAWYRLSFDGSVLGEYMNLTLHLGYIDDVHEVYLNGQLIGFKGSFPPDYYSAYDVLNSYKIPDNLIDPKGTNTIAVKVYDLYREGGIIKGDLGIYHEPKLGKEFYSLEGVWRFSTKREVDWEEPEFDDDDWSNILVPGFWRSKNIKRSKGYGWYRLDFRLPDHLKDKDLILLLGYIDDFDYTYLNGEFVGSTKDNMPLYETNSYRNLRAYKIPSSLLSPNGINTLAVQVEDLGFEAGIYKGPIGLSPQQGR